MTDKQRQGKTFKVCDHELRVRVRPEEEKYFVATAEMVNEVWAEMVKIHPYDRQQAMAMTVFQLAAELLEAREELRGMDQGEERLSRLLERIRTATQSTD